jgi:hypothetical protein
MFTYKVLDASSLKVVYRYLLCPDKPDDPNLCAELLWHLHQSLILMNSSDAHYSWMHNQMAANVVLAWSK